MDIIDLITTKIEECNVNIGIEMSVNQRKLTLLKKPLVMTL
jgi:hypothetical protein